MDHGEQTAQRRFVVRIGIVCLTMFVVLGTGVGLSIARPVQRPVFDGRVGVLAASSQRLEGRIDLVALVQEDVGSGLEVGDLASLVGPATVARDVFGAGAETVIAYSVGVGPGGGPTLAIAAVTPPTGVEVLDTSTARREQGDRQSVAAIVVLASDVARATVQIELIVDPEGAEIETNLDVEDLPVTSTTFSTSTTAVEVVAKPSLRAELSTSTAEDERDEDDRDDAKDEDEHDEDDRDDEDDDEDDDEHDHDRDDEKGEDEHDEDDGDEDDDSDDDDDEDDEDDEDDDD